MHDSTRNDGPQLFEVELLPARAAYLIRAGSRTGFRRAVQEASTRWGGMCEPIVCVRRGGNFDGWTKQVVEVAKVDAVVNIDVAEDDAIKVADRLGLPLVPLSEIDRWGEAAWTSNPSSLPPLFESVPVIAVREAPLWQVAAVGDLNDDAEAELENAQVYARRVWEQDGIGRAQLFRNSLLEQTVSRFRENRASPGWGSIPSIIWVVKKNSLNECVFFWNLRALRPLRFSPSNLIILPDGEVEHWLGFDTQLHSQLARPDEFSPDVLIDSWTVPEGSLHAMAATLGLTQSQDELRTGHRMPAPIRTPPFTYQVNVEPRDWFVGDRRYGETSEIEAIVNLGQVRLRFDSPIPFERPGRTKLRVRSASFSSMPKRAFLARLVHRDGTWSEDSIQLATSASSVYNFEFHVPTAEEVNEALLINTVQAHSLSDKGRMGVALLSSDPHNSLLGPGVFGAVQGLTTPRSKELLRELGKLKTVGAESADLIAIASRWGGRGERRVRAAHQLESANAASALESLCANGWAERGFELKCKNCGLASFVLLDQVTSAPLCPACRARGQFSSTDAGPVVFYRLNSFLDQASDQGVVPHVLAVESLRSIRSAESVLPGIDITFHDARRAEVDLFGVVDGKVAAGEVKTSPGEFTEQQMSNDVRNAAALGADIYVLAAPHDLADAQLNRAAALAAKSGLELLVLGPPELQPSQN
jgi:hypothetical protein